MSFLDVKELLSKLLISDERKYKGFLIGTTAHFASSESYYLTPFRQSELISYAGVIVKDVDTANRIAVMADGKVDFLFVDSEKKIPSRNYGLNDSGNLEKSIGSLLNSSTLLTYKGNDLTLRSADMLLRSLAPDATSVKIAVIGVGNLGTKIAMSLLERGGKVHLFSEDVAHVQETCELLDKIKPPGVLASPTATNSLQTALSGAQIVIATTNRKHYLNLKHIEFCSNFGHFGAPILIDVGKGCFSDEVVRSVNQVFRVDIEHELSSELDSLVRLNLMWQTVGCRQLSNGKRLIRKGLVGLEGDYVVDNPSKPTQVIGRCVGNGMLSVLSELENLEILSDLG